MTSSSSSSYNHTAFPDESEFLDSEPLHLSGVSEFDFILDDEDDEINDSEVDGDADRLFADSKGSADLDAFLDSQEAAMDFEFETVESSLTKMSFSAITEESETMRNSGNSQGYRPQSRRRNRNSSSGPQDRSSRFSVNAVNFDPPAAQQQRHSYSLTQSMPPQRVGGFGQPRRLASESDLSMCSYSTAQSTPMPNPVPALRRVSEGPNLTEASYNDALRNLAESMKRTEATRRHVMMQRDMLSPVQQAALSSAKEQLQAQYQQVQQQATQEQQQTTAPESAPQEDMQQESSQRSSIMAAFFSGSRGTLTNNLAQSRKQLGLYMNQMNNQTL